MRTLFPTLILFSACLATASASAQTNPAEKTTAGKQSVKSEGPSVPTGKNWKDYLSSALKLWREGKQGEATSDLDRALAGAERMKDGARAKAMAEIGEAYLEMGVYPKAASLLEDSIKTAPRFLPQGSEKVRTLDHLAQALVRIGELEKADKVSKEALSSFDGGSKTSKPVDYAKCLGTRAQVLKAQRNYVEAEKMLGESLKLLTSVEGTESLTRARLLLNLGGVFLEDGKLEEAEKVILEANSIIQQKVPTGDPLFKLTNKSQRVLSQKKLEAMLAANADPYRPEVAAELAELADYYIAEGDNVLALETISKAISIKEKVAPQDGAALAGMVSRRAEILEKLGAKKEASIAQTRARELKAQ